MAKLRAGLRLLVPPSRPGQDVAGTRLKQRGARVLTFPWIRSAPPSDPQALAEGLGRLEPGDWLLVSGKPSAEAVLEQRNQPQAGIRCGVIGQGALLVFRKAGIEVVSAPRLHTPEAITQALGSVDGRRVLLVRASLSDQALPEALRSAGATVLDVEGYALTVHADPDAAKEALAWPLDAVVLANPTAVDVLADGLAALERDAEDCFPMVPILAIGPETDRAARRRRLEPDLVAEGRIKHMLQAVDGLFGGPDSP
jgi:uroporphyrinogen-III synthase